MRVVEISNSHGKRIWNHEVFKNIQGVMDSILNLFETVPHQAPSSPTLLPEGSASGPNCHIKRPIDLMAVLILFVPAHIAMRLIRRLITPSCLD